MPDADFPSGPWTGYYQYPDGKRGGMDLALRFESGRMTGSGSDELGKFFIEGSYSTESREAKWLKSYPDGHQVNYRGFREGPVKGIWGTWMIVGNSSGGFHIWPVDDGRLTNKNLKAADGKEIGRSVKEAAGKKSSGKILAPAKK